HPRDRGGDPRDPPRHPAPRGPRLPGRAEGRGAERRSPVPALPDAGPPGEGERVLSRPLRVSHPPEGFMRVGAAFLMLLALGPAAQAQEVDQDKVDEAVQKASAFLLKKYAKG